MGVVRHRRVIIVFASAADAAAVNADTDTDTDTVRNSVVVSVIVAVTVAVVVVVVVFVVAVPWSSSSSLLSPFLWSLPLQWRRQGSSSSSPLAVVVLADNIAPVACLRVCVSMDTVSVRPGLCPFVPVRVSSAIETLSLSLSLFGLHA